MTRIPLSRFKGHRSLLRHQAALLTAVLTRQAASAVVVRTCWPWETAATLPSAQWCKALRRPQRRIGAGHIVAAARLQLVRFVTGLSDFNSLFLVFTVIDKLLTPLPLFCDRAF